MNAVLQPVLEPLLAQSAVRSVLLAGSDASLIAWLLDMVGPDGPLIHVACDAFSFDVGAMRAKGGDRLMLHPARAAAALALMPVPDILIIDGDWNWYSVHSALQAAARQAARLSASFPLTLVSGTAWPTGRRDRYANPGALPANFVRPHERAGVLPGHPALAAGAGLFADHFHARNENQPGNGVLTAVEEFLLEQDGRLGLVSLPLLHGLSLIYSRSEPMAGHVQSALESIRLGAAARGLAEACELARLEQAAEAARLRMALASAQYRIDATRDALDRERSEWAKREQARLAASADEPQPARGFPSGLRPAIRAAMSAAGLRRGGGAAAQASQDEALIGQLRQSPILDAAWYRSRYDDIGGANIDPAEHYFRHGAAELRDPGPAFSTRYYLETYPDVAEAGRNPVLHYLADGALEGRDPGPDFSTVFYLQSNPDVAQAGLNPLEHWLVSGRQEKRPPRPSA